MTKEIEVKHTDGNDPMAVAKFTLAVNRTKPGEADFINCVAFKQTAEFLGKYFEKGSQIAVTGRIQTGSYTKQDGTKVYTTDVIVDHAEFAGGAKQEPEPEQKPPTPAEEDGFMQATFEGGLPFR